MHKHEATHFHWDLRLQFGLALKSWAIPKIPPLKKGVKRLAIKVPDHHLSYAVFSGIIPEGSYGAGKVEIWDKGTFTTISKNNNKIVMRFRGKRLKGKYVLMKFKKSKKQWLFFKI